MAKRGGDLAVCRERAGDHADSEAVASGGVLTGRVVGGRSGRRRELPDLSRAERDLGGGGCDGGSRGVVSRRCGGASGGGGRRGEVEGMGEGFFAHGSEDLYGFGD